MSSAANKEQFLKQFEVIVEGIKQNKAKVRYAAVEQEMEFQCWFVVMEG